MQVLKRTPDIVQRKAENMFRGEAAAILPEFELINAYLGRGWRIQGIANRATAAYDRGDSFTSAACPVEIG